MFRVKTFACALSTTRSIDDTTVSGPLAFIQKNTSKCAERRKSLYHSDAQWIRTIIFSIQLYRVSQKKRNPHKLIVYSLKLLFTIRWYFHASGIFFVQCKPKQNKFKVLSYTDFHLSVFTHKRCRNKASLTELCVAVFAHYAKFCF